jgi:two-component system alkaline phosphatase synthesis response regulator PhoP
MPHKILVVEDEPQIVTVLSGYLKNAGFDVITAADGQRGLELARLEQPDLLILDLMLPEMDGIDVARAIRQDRQLRTANLPIIMLTARTQESDKLVGLELGADDYITKPFSPREVVARVRALLRRVERMSQPAARIHRRGPISVDVDRRLVQLVGQPIELTRTEFDLLHTLISSPGRAFTRMELLEATAGDAYDGYERTIDVHIKNLRRKLGDRGRRPRFVQTVVHYGYRFAADLEDEG